ncbi:MAG: DUF4091 domain-containing protein [Acidobacteriota bacterium]|nr:MAG: DUF4091 domain-containing protein [Acidobacteriota bacterium]
MRKSQHLLIKFTFSRLTLLTLFMLGLITPSGLAGVHQIWAVGDGERVEQDYLFSPLKASNSIWNGGEIVLYGARNEIVAFQVIVEADTEGIAQLSASLPKLVHTTTGSKITYRPPASDPTDYTDRDIQLFSVNYMQVNQATRASWMYEIGPSAPADPLGSKPVQIIPENARADRGGFPLRVSRRYNQSIWIEIYTGRDRPSGSYQGTLEVTADSTLYTIPVTLNLWDFNLPETNSIDAMIYFESGQPLLYHGRRLDTEYHRFAHRNRIELVHSYSIASATDNQGRFHGTDFTGPRGYRGPGEGIGNRIIPATFYGPGSAFNERGSAWQTSDAWITFLDGLLSDYLTFVYLPDEPNSSQWPEIRNIADNIHSNPGPGGRLPVFVTSAYTPALDSWIDYWCSPPQRYDRSRALKERAKGHEFWTYNGGRPYLGAIVIDAPATDARATIWACFKHEISLYFYWHSVHWQHNHQLGPAVEKNQNIWLNPVTFDNGGSYGNGDGVLIYPGEEIVHPDQDRGVPGPISSFRLANFRRGLQDHQYLTLARRMGLSGLVDEVIDEVVPRVFSETDGNLGFTEDEATFESARRRLGDAIETARSHRRRR